MVVAMMKLMSSDHKPIEVSLRDNIGDAAKTLCLDPDDFRE